MVDEHTLARQVFERIGGGWAVVIALVIVARNQLAAGASALFHAAFGLIRGQRDAEQAAVSALLQKYDEQLNDFRASRAEVEAQLEEMRDELRDLLDQLQRAHVENATLAERNRQLEEQVRELLEREQQREARLQQLRERQRERDLEIRELKDEVERLRRGVPGAGRLR